MIPELGHLALILALVLAGVQTLAGLRADAPPRLVYAATGLQALALTGALAALAWAFAVQDYSVTYVVQHSNLELPLVYRLAAVWGGHEGSMLLWAWVLALWTLAAAAVLGPRDAALAARSLGVLGLVALAILGFVLFTSNPFIRLLPAAQDGQNLNPLLQDPGLVLHPPLLYLGYVGTAVPFAVVLGRCLLPADAVPGPWVRWLRPFALAALAALTLGIALGSWWAYYELGWGGWWFWDPVENASFMPWLALAALVHALAAREQRGVLGGWVGVLAVTAFALSLVGTFLVRSGVLTSVHAFATDPRRGSAMLAIVALTLVGSTLLLSAHSRRLLPAQPPRRYALASREALLTLNNALLLAACASVLLGTLYPLLMDALALGKISVGPPYFDSVLQPLLLPLLLLGALAPGLRWGQMAPADWLRQQRAPLLLGALGLVLIPAALYASWGRIQPATALTLLLALLLAATALQPLLRRGAGIAAWGMALGHLGLALFAAGVALVGGYGVERDVRLAPGDSTPVAECRLHFVGVRPARGPNYASLQGQFQLDCPGQTPLMLVPEKRAYPGSAMPMTESAIAWGLRRDIYVALGEMLDGQPHGAWLVRVQHKPLMRGVWGGALLMALGCVLALLARRYRHDRRNAQESA